VPALVKAGPALAHTSLLGTPADKSGDASQRVVRAMRRPAKPRLPRTLDVSRRAASLERSYDVQLLAEESSLKFLRRCRGSRT